MTGFNLALRMRRDLLVTADIGNYFALVRPGAIIQRRESNSRNYPHEEWVALGTKKK